MFKGCSVLMDTHYFKECSNVQTKNKRTKSGSSPYCLPFSLVYEFVFLLCEQWALQCLLLLCCLSIRCLTERWAEAALSLNASISLSPFRSHRPRNGGSIRHDPRTHTVLHYPSSQPTAFRPQSLDPSTRCA